MKNELEKYVPYFEKLKVEGFIRNRTENTITNYISHIKPFLKWTGYKDVDDLNLDDARNFILDKRKQGASAASCNNYNSAIAFFYKRVLGKEWDFEYVPRMRIERKLPEVLSMEEIVRMIDAATEPRNKAIIALLYSSGMRVGELSRIKMKDINRKNMLIHVEQTKNHCDHWSSLSDTALKYLEEYWYSFPLKREYLFVAQKAPYGQLKPSGIEIMIRKVAKDAGIERPVHPHMLRHSFATHMLEQRAPIEIIQTMLGHKSVNSTQLYLHVTNKRLIGVDNPLDLYLRKCDENE